MELDKYSLKQHMIVSFNVMILGIVYLLFGLLGSYIINHFSIEPKHGDSKHKLLMEICAEIAITVLYSYFVDVLVDRLPLPMLGSKKLKHQIVDEVRGGIVITFAVFTLQVKLRNKVIMLFYDRPENTELNTLVSLN